MPGKRNASDSLGNSPKCLCASQLHAKVSFIQAGCSQLYAQARSMLSVVNATFGSLKSWDIQPA